MAFDAGKAPPIHHPGSLDKIGLQDLGPVELRAFFFTDLPCSALEA